MRLAYALLALSLAGNAAWLATSLLWPREGESRSGPVDEMPVASPEPARVTPLLAAPSPTSDAAAPKAGPTGGYMAPWERGSTPPALGPPSVRGVAEALPTTPAVRLAYRLGRAPTADETSALGTMVFDSQLGSADRLASEIAARRARDEAKARPGGALVARLLPLADRHPKDDEKKTLVDMIASREFEDAFPAGGYGPVLRGDVDLDSDKAILADGALIAFGEGTFDLRLDRQGEKFAYRPFPRDVTVAGAGPTKTLLRIDRSLKVNGPVVNLVVKDASLDFAHSDLAESRQDPVLVRLVNCRIGGTDLGRSMRAGAIWLDACECDGAWGNGSDPLLQVSDGRVLVRMDRCILTLREPFDRHDVTAVLTDCTLREQSVSSKGRATGRLVNCVVQRCTSDAEWQERVRASRSGSIESLFSKSRR